LKKPLILPIKLYAGGYSMTKHIDAKGKACPLPVVLAKKELDGGVNELTIDVDNAVAVENLKRLAGHEGCSFAVTEKDGIFTVSFARESEAEGKNDISKETQPAVESPTLTGKDDWAVLVTRQSIGEGSQELGQNLMKMFFYTLTQSENPPKTIIFMNEGVKLPTLNEQVIEHLQVLKSQGTSIMVCGTCLNYYELADRLQIGEVSNMYDIVNCLEAAHKVMNF